MALYMEPALKAARENNVPRITEVVANALVDTVHYIGWLTTVTQEAFKHDALDVVQALHRLEGQGKEKGLLAIPFKTSVYAHGTGIDWTYLSSVLVNSNNLPGIRFLVYNKLFQIKWSHNELSGGITSTNPECWEQILQHATKRVGDKNIVHPIPDGALRRLCVNVEKLHKTSTCPSEEDCEKLLALFQRAHDTRVVNHKHYMYRLRTACTHAQ